MATAAIVGSPIGMIPIQAGEFTVTAATVGTIIPATETDAITGDKVNSNNTFRQRLDFLPYLWPFEHRFESNQNLLFVQQ